ncbi:MAG: WecB/TagA/CpsF family glycosyltransferase [Planctomycetota bacterium]
MSHTEPPLSELALRTVRVGALELQDLRRGELVDHIFTQLESGRGGWVFTANLDHLQRCARQPEYAALYSEADIRVADGTPLIWAARLSGTPLADRVAGSDLVWLVAAAAERHGRSIYLLGGAPGAAEGASEVLLARWPSLKICGLGAPDLSLPPTADEVESAIALLAAARPDIVYLGFSSPKQEYFIRLARKRLPTIWFLGVGISLSFIAGHVRRAPRWMQRTGLEWLHRMWQEPRRLARRYLVDGLPFAVRLLWGAWFARRRRTDLI